MTNQERALEAVENIINEFGKLRRDGVVSDMWYKHMHELRSAYECAMRAYFCNNDYHSEALKKEVDDLLVLLHKVYQQPNQTEE